MAVVLILSNIGASKGVEIGPFITDGGFFLFPLAYVVGDVISEVYGFKAARYAVALSFCLSIFVALSFWVIITLPGASWYDGQEELARTLGPVWQIVAASVLAFAVGQILNSYVLVKLKQRSGEKNLAVRLLGSSAVGQLADTLVFCSIAAGVIGVSGAGDFSNYVLTGVAYKIAIEALFLPVTTFTIGKIKKYEPTYELG